VRRLYRWWVFVHLLGVFGFLGAHGVSMFALFRIRAEADPRRVADLVELSASSIGPFYASLGVLLLGGVVAATLGGWWGHAWIWASIGVLLAASLAMYALAKPYTERVGVVARSLLEGTEAVTQEQFAQVRRALSGLAVAWIGGIALAAILYLMIFKPSLGLGPHASPVRSAPQGAARVELSASDSASFSAGHLRAPGGEVFVIEFGNREPGVAHNVAIYRDEAFSEALFVGVFIDGGRSIRYVVGPLSGGTYPFRCDAHPAMAGTLEVR
jgi:plastocyanin